MEKSIGDFKRRLAQRMQDTVEPPPLIAAVESTTHELNHQPPPRRCLHGRTACDLFHDPVRHQHWHARDRDRIFQLLTTTFCDTLQSMAATDHHAIATAWRRTVESWLRCQGLIRIGPNTKSQQDCVNHFSQKMVS